MARLRSQTAPDSEERVRDAMVRDVVTFPPDMRMEEPVRLFASRRLNGGVVLNTQGELVCFLFEHDVVEAIRALDLGVPRVRFRSRRSHVANLLKFLRSRKPAAARTLEDWLHTQRVSDSMRKNVVTTSPDSSLLDVARRMQEHAIPYVPVIDQNRVVGVVTYDAVVRLVLRHASDWLVGV